MLQRALVFGIGCAVFVGCAENAPEADLVATSASPLTADETAGQQLFNTETFGGNGRTCLTCHSAATGTFNAAAAQARFAANPNETLFRAIDSDDGTGSSYNTLLSKAVVHVRINLPPNVKLADDPSATSVLLWRGVPTNFNTPAVFDTFGGFPGLQYDGREASLLTQAASAISFHAQATVTPTATQLNQIATFQKTLFNNTGVQRWVATGVKPVLPKGDTQVERLGASVFQRSCAFCHGGPFLNEAASFVGGGPGVAGLLGVAGGKPNGGLGSGDERATVFLNPTNPLRTYVVTSPAGTQYVTTPDPGRLLVTGVFGDANRMRIPTLSGISKTAPYFSDAHAQTLEAVTDHYQAWFNLVGGDGANQENNAQRLSNEDKTNLVAFLKLL